MQPEHQAVLAECASEQSFEAGAILFREGEPANQLYLIESGKVALEMRMPAGGMATIQVLGPDELLGWSWLFPPFTWHLQARALEPVRTVVLNGGHLLATAEEDTRFGYCLMKRVAQMVIHRLQATRRQMIPNSVK